ncbi:hypothetical protein JCM8097_005045 [Rhodosporidiobolus ruineniae]
MASSAPHDSPNSPSNKHKQPMMTSDELDWLVYSYLEESGYHHTAFSLLHESALAGPSSSSASSSAANSPSLDRQPNGHDRRASTPGAAGSGRNPVMDTVVPPGHLVRILQKGLLYLEAEARYRGDPPTPKPRLVGYPISSTLPLPPLPKYVPPPAPPAPPAPAASTSTSSRPPSAAEKGKAKAKPAASTSASTDPAPAPSVAAAAAGGAAGTAKRKGPANQSDREDGAADGPKRPRTASAETQTASASASTSTGGSAAMGGAGGKKKKGGEKAEKVEEKEKEQAKEKDVKGKGKAKAVVQDEQDGDTAMEDAPTAPAPEERRGSTGAVKKVVATSAAVEKEKERPSSSAGAAAGAGPKDGEKDKEKKPADKEKGKEREVSGGSASSGSGLKREREKEKKSSAGDEDLRPPPAKKSATPASSSAPPAPPASSASTTTTTPATKRSISPTTSRKPAPKPSSSTSASASEPPASSTASSSALPTPLGQGTGKIRITTQTKTITTPLSSSAGGGGASTPGGGSRPGSSHGPPAQGQGQAERLLKVKSEGEPSTSAGSPAKNGSSSSASSSSRVPPPPPPPAPGAKKNGKERAEKSSNSSSVAEGGKTKTAGGGGAPAKVDMKGTKRVGSEDVRGVIKLTGHTNSVQPCAFNSHVPSLLATGASDSTCRIWDVPLPSSSSSSSTSQQVVEDHIVCKHASAQRKVDITVVAWDPSGSLLATGSEDGIARIWTPSGDLHLVLSMHMRSICSLKWSPSGTLLLTSSLDQTVCLWELSSGKVRQQYATHADSVLDVDWLDEQTWASASMDKTVHLLSTTRPTPLYRFRGHRDEVNAVHFSPCGTLLASASDDSTVRIHSLRSIAAISASVAARPVKKGDSDRKIDQDAEDGGGGGVWVLEGHKGEVHQVAWHPKAGKEGEDGPRLIASCSFDHTARLWDADAGTCLYTFARSTDYVYSVAFEPDLGRWLATGSNDGRLDVWSVQDRTLALEYNHASPIYELAWHPHGTQIAVTGQSANVAVVAFDGKAMGKKK